MIPLIKVVKKFARPDRFQRQRANDDPRPPAVSLPGSRRPLQAA
jgi:hypothetical protein